MQFSLPFRQTLRGRGGGERAWLQGKGVDTGTLPTEPTTHQRSSCLSTTSPASR